MWLDLQIASDLDTDNVATSIPEKSAFESWVAVALQGENNDSELTIRIVSEHEISELNQLYRDKTGSTNVLSFPFEMPDFTLSDEPDGPLLDDLESMGRPLLGDLVICAAVVQREALEQKKPLEAHWAHMVIHGLLHLLGYDHIQNIEAEVMEKLEITRLSELGYPTPY